MKFPVVGVKCTVVVSSAEAEDKEGGGRENGSKCEPLVVNVRVAM